MVLTLQGILLFLFIPLVLFLYLRQPFGPAVSILVGLVIMFGHRFVAAPWMARHATQRCLWCGRSVRPDDASRLEFHVSAAGNEHRVVACRTVHRELAGRFLTFVVGYRLPIAIGIFAPLIVLLVASLALGAGRPLFAQEWNTWQFKTIVAVTVVVTSLFYRTVAQPDAALRSPFPLHNLFLLGIRNTLWVFRVVGAWWIVAGMWQILSR